VNPPSAPLHLPVHLCISSFLCILLPLPVPHLGCSHLFLTWRLLHFDLLVGGSPSPPGGSLFSPAISAISSTPAVLPAWGRLQPLGTAFSAPHFLSTLTVSLPLLDLRAAAGALLHLLHHSCWTHLTSLCHCTVLPSPRLFSPLPLPRSAGYLCLLPQHLFWSGFPVPLFLHGPPPYLFLFPVLFFCIFVLPVLLCCWFSFRIVRFRATAVLDRIWFAAASTPRTVCMCCVLVRLCAGFLRTAAFL